MHDARRNPPRRLKDLLADELFEAIPFNLAVIDRDFNVVHANSSFKRHFGDWRGKKCYMVYKKLHQPCDECPSAQVFAEGKVVVAESVGVDHNGHQTHYIGHAAPLRRTPGGSVEFVLEMTRNLTGARSWQQEKKLYYSENVGRRKQQNFI